MSDAESPSDAESDGPPSIRASISIRNFSGSPNEITRILGVEPSRSGTAGELRRNVRGRLTSEVLERSYWSLDSSMPPRSTLAQHIDDLLAQVRPITLAFSQLPPGTTVTLFSTIIPNGKIPTLSIHREAMRSLVEIGADVDILFISVVDAPEG